MGQPYIGEIRMFAGNYAPAGWAFCNGQTMPIPENEALFQLIGTTYGGDGQETFNLPDLRGRLPLHVGKLVSSFLLGESGGTEEVTLTISQMPLHTHAFMASTGPGNLNSPTGNLTGESATVKIYVEDTPAVPMNPAAIVPVGGSQPHSNVQPFLCISFIIALFGVFPTQT